MKSQQGYTLVELMIVITIAAVLASVAWPSYSSYMDREDVAMSKKDIFLINGEVERYFAMNGQYPPDLATINKSINDPWGNPYQYVTTALADESDKRKDGGTTINTDFDLYSKGADGDSASNINAGPSLDDVVRADNGEFTGLASAY